MQEDDNDVPLAPAEELQQQQSNNKEEEGIVFVAGGGGDDHRRRSSFSAAGDDDGEGAEQGTNNNSPSLSAGAAATCDMCSNYETNLTKLQDTERDLKEQLTASQELASRYEREISDERVLRKEMEQRLTQLSSEYSAIVRRVDERETRVERRLQEFAEKQSAALAACEEELEKARTKWQQLEKDFVKLGERYRRLLGAHRASAQAMREQQIELPQSPAELQFLALQLREELIEARAAREHEVEGMRDELAIARTQLAELLEHQQHEAESVQLSQELARGGSPSLQQQLLVMAAINQQQQRQHSPSNQMHSPASASGRYDLMPAGVEDDPIACRQVITELEAQLSHSVAERAKLESKLTDYRRRCTTLKRELDTSETVQKDFVRLSQDLQIQLERIRQDEHEIRWQHEDDVQICQRCTTDFSATRMPKANCKHCGKIFCPDCLQHSIPAGPNRRPTPVCAVCHTILNRDSAPFFSTSSAKSVQPQKVGISTGSGGATTPVRSQTSPNSSTGSGGAQKSGEKQTPTKR